MRVDIEMGEATGEKPAMLDLEELLATRLLVQGNSGSGKSHLLRRLLEQSAPWVQQCIIDPEGDFVTLSDRYGHVVVDAARSENELIRIARRIRQHRVSVVLNLEGLEADQQMRCAAAFLNAMFDADREHWYPLLVVVDEAQLFAPAAGGEVAEDARRASLGAMTNLMCRGRKRGMAGIIATQRLAKLAKNVAAEASNFLMGRTFLDIDMARAADLLGMDRRQAETFRDLPRGRFVALGPALSRRPLTISIGAVETEARSTSPKLTPLPEAPAPEEARDLVFTPAADEEKEPLRRVSRPAPRPTGDILADLASATPAGPASEPPAEAPVVDEAERARLLDRVFASMLEEAEHGFRSDAERYQDFCVRCRIARVPGEALPLAEFRRRFAMARAGVDAEIAMGEDWQRLSALTATLPEDVQGIFVLVAEAARAGHPCPSDATLAEAYGTHSTRRARRLLDYFEERDLIVLREDFSGNRIVALPDLGCESKPGDPNGPAEAHRHRLSAA
jgi:hypothetical protein